MSNSGTIGGGSGDPGAPGGGVSSLCERLVAGLWGFTRVDDGDGDTPNFEIAPTPVGSCREWDYGTTVTNTNDNGYGHVADDGTVIITVDGGDAVRIGIGAVDSN